MTKKSSACKVKQDAVKLKEFLLKAELDRLSGDKTYSSDEAKELLLAKIDNMWTKKRLFLKSL